MFDNPFLNEMARSVLVGFSASVVFVGALLAFDLAHLRELTFGSEHGLLAIGLLFFFCGLTFSGAQMTFRVFADWRYEEDEAGPGVATGGARPRGEAARDEENASSAPKIPRNGRRNAPAR